MALQRGSELHGGLRMGATTQSYQQIKTSPQIMVGRPRCVHVYHAAAFSFPQFTTSNM